MSTISIDDVTGVIRTTSAFAAQQDDGEKEAALPHVNLLWTHYKTARGTLEHLAAEAKDGGQGLDVHSPFVDRAMRLLEVLILRKEKVRGWVQGSGLEWGLCGGWIDLGRRTITSGSAGAPTVHNRARTTS